MTEPPFIIYGLPRSRTAWLADFLTYGDWSCFHETTLHMRSIADIQTFLAREKVGTSETAAAPGWRLIHHYSPDIRAVVVKRAPEDALASMLQLGISYDMPELKRILAYLVRIMDEISDQPNVLTIDYDDLATEGGCAAVFEHCLPYRFDRPWWLWYKDRNRQIDVKALMAYYTANKAAIDGFKRLCWNEMRALRRAGVLAKAA